MPASGVKVTMFFQDDVFGFTESHILLGATDLGNTNQNSAYTLFKARLQVSGFGVQPTGVRLSLVGNPRASITLDPATFVGIAPTLNTISGAGVEAEANNSDQPKASLLLKAYAGFQRKSLYLGGVPDPILGENPKTGRPAAYSQWYTLYQSYANVLLGNSPKWGFQIRNNAAPFNLVNTGGFSQQPMTGLLGVSVATADKTFAIGDLVQIRGVKRTNVAYATANGMWTVASIGLATPDANHNTYYLLNSSQVQANTLTSFGQIQKVDFQSAQYTSIQIAGQTTRKRGNRFLAPLGRRRVRKALII